jgi:hypothetical protein
VKGGGAQTWQLGLNGTWSLGEASANGFYLTDGFGWNLGLGYSFRTSSGQVFVEAKYVQIQTSNENSEYIPLTIGFRCQANAWLRITVAFRTRIELLSPATNQSREARSP